MSSYSGYLSSRDLERIPFFIGYLREGLSVLLQRRNFGFVAAFDNTSLNQSGLLLSGKEFAALCKELQIGASLVKETPEIFYLTLRYSPIAQFKRWIFSVSNRRLISVSHRDKLWEKDLFLLDSGGGVSFISVLNNIAQERFLLDVYECPRIPETQIRFRITFKDRTGLALYRSYRSGKLSLIKIPDSVPLDVPQDVRIVFMRNYRVIRYRVTIEKNNYISHTIRFAEGSGGSQFAGKKRSSVTIPSKKESYFTKSKSSSSASSGVSSVTPGEKSTKLMVAKFTRRVEEIDYQKDLPKVLEILQENDKKEFQTNRFANVSLGRVSKIPILLNLAAKYVNCMIRVILDSEEEVSVFHGEDLVKKFAVLHTPKSNWLGKRPKVERSK